MHPPHTEKDANLRDRREEKIQQQKKKKRTHIVAERRDRDEELRRFVSWRQPNG